MGTAAAGNVPGGREISASWIDSSGNLWLFGGQTTAGWMNDLWKFSPSTKEWTWVSGSSAAAQYGSYGTMGTPSAANVPSSRDAASSWIDSSGNLWLFGGFGWDSEGITTDMNDLWEFNPSTTEWTWVGGSQYGTQQLGAGSYGTLGTPAPGNIPGGREGASAWTDSSGKVWLFGGFGFGANANLGSLNDLWELNPSTNEWAWMGGSSTTTSANTGQPGVYGTLGTPAAGNIPGGRQFPSIWTDRSGNFWLLGGGGADANGTSGYLNDLWEFSPATNEWTWMGGSSTVPAAGSGQPGIYGTLGTPAATNVPGGREQGATWTDTSGNLWLFGGYGDDTNGTAGVLNDLWKYQLAATASPAAATPTFSVTPGTYSTVQSVTISDSTPGATIYYTTNGTTPTTSSSVYSGTITVSSTETLEAIATASGYTTSPVATAAYTINLAAAATPTFSVTPGTYSSAQSVTISDTTPGATIYYTTNGTTPTTSSSVYSGTITVSSTETLEAIATASGYTTSAVATAAYTINLAAAATPTFSVPAGTYSSAQSVTISDTTPSAKIYYTTNGTTPTTSSSLYSGAITVSSTETLEAIATASGYSTSAVATAAYTISSSVTPTFTISSTTTAQTIQPGGTATYAVTASAVNGTFPNAVTLAASGLPAGATATFSPTSITPGSSSATSTLTIQTEKTAAAATTKSAPWPLAVPALALIGFFFLPGKRRRRWITLAVLLFASLGAFSALTACGGGFGMTAGATSYNITVTGSSGSVQQSTTVQLTVQ
jgi:hypothetical protein